MYIPLQFKTFYHNNFETNSNTRRTQMLGQNFAKFAQKVKFGMLNFLLRLVFTRINDHALFSVGT